MYYAGKCDETNPDQHNEHFRHDARVCDIKLMAICFLTLDSHFCLPKKHKSRPTRGGLTQPPAATRLSLSSIPARVLSPKDRSFRGPAHAGFSFVDRSPPSRPPDCWRSKGKLPRRTRKVEAEFPMREPKEPRSGSVASSKLQDQRLSSTPPRLRLDSSWVCVVAGWIGRLRGRCLLLAV